MQDEKGTKKNNQKSSQARAKTKMQAEPAEYKDKKEGAGRTARNTGIPGITLPQASCDDKNCPFHSSLKIRGRTFTGIVTSAKAKKTATVRWTRLAIIQKYERYEKRKTKLSVHNPPCINAAEGDEVLIAECRPLSKTKNFVILSITRKSTQ